MQDIDFKSLKEVYGFTPLHPGSGPLLGLKLTLMALQTNDANIKSKLIVSGPAAMAAEAVKNQEVVVTNRPASALRSVSLIKNALAFSDDMSTISALPSLILASRNSENLLFISYTTDENSLVKSAPASYIATACTAYPEDYITKIRKATQLKGIRFIEILCPDPKSGFDTADTIEMGRLAVESGVWPLFEYDGALALTKRPVHLEPVERYVRAQKRYSTISDQHIKEWQDAVAKRWKMLLDGKVY